MLRGEEDTDAEVISLFLILFHEKIFLKKVGDPHLETAEGETVSISKVIMNFLVLFLEIWLLG